MSSDGSTDDGVRATVELAGDYDEIAAILGGRAGPAADLDPVLSDLTTVLEIVQRTDGATKSRLAEELPNDLAVDLDADSVIHALRVLELYDLIELDGNTWQPGPALSTE
jgi:hypothetical protein